MRDDIAPGKIWFVVDENDNELWFQDEKPDRYVATGGWILHTAFPIYGDLWPGAIKAITGRTITWADEPIEWKPGENANETAIKLLVQAHSLVGNPGTNISSSTDIACDKWQEDYQNWKQEYFKINKP